MPYSIKKNKDGKTYRVTGPSGTHAVSTTKKRAEAQVRIMEQAERKKK